MIRVFGITLKCYLSWLSKWQSKVLCSLVVYWQKCYTIPVVLLIYFVLFVLWPSCYSCYIRYLCYFGNYTRSRAIVLSCYLLCYPLLYFDSLVPAIFRYSAIKCVNYLKPAWAWDLSPTGRYRSPYVIWCCVLRWDRGWHIHSRGREWPRVKPGVPSSHYVILEL